MNTPKTLNQIAEEVRNCRDCPLSRGRTNAVPGEGPDNASIMFIAEGPGYHEDAQGRPFVGQAGKSLDNLLEKAGIARADVFITNIVKCRTPQNRNPLDSEIQACDKHLQAQIQALNPELIAPLGQFAMERFLPGNTISKVAGTPVRKDGRTIYPVIHPAAGLRRNETREKITKDFLALPDVVQRVHHDPDSIPEAQDAATTAKLQGTLF